MAASLKIYGSAAEPAKMRSMKITPPEKTQRYPVPALDKGLDLLELLAQHPRGMSLSELAGAASRKVSEIFRMVDCLKRRGYIGHDVRSDRLVLTMRLFELAHRYPPTERMVAAALPEMEALTREVGQSCHLAVHSAGDMLVIAQVDSPLQMGFAVHVGARVGLTTSASGRVFLAFQKAAERARVLALQDKPAVMESPTRKPKLRPGKAQVAAAIARIQKQGYESVPSDLIRGVTNMSYPVLDFSEQSAACLTIPFLQWDGPGHCDRETTCRRLGQAAQAISFAIGLLEA